MAHVDFPINNHLERLDYDEIRERPSLFGDLWCPALGGFIGGHMLPLYNVGRGKPLLTGIWRLGLLIPGGVMAGLWYRDYHKEQSRKKWAMIRHYIELHPEDFPDYPPRIKIGETLAPWYPRRPGW